jgi:hypothetical protein
MGYEADEELPHIRRTHTVPSDRGSVHRILAAALPVLLPDALDHRLEHERASLFALAGEGGGAFSGHGGCLLVGVVVCHLAREPFGSCLSSGSTA